MAGWDYLWKAGPAGGSLESLANYCTFVRLPAESATGRRGTNPIVQYRHGEYPSPRKYVRPASLLLETGVRYTNAAGVVTHTDGAAGHAYENLGHLKRLLGGNQGTLVRLQRTAPDQGQVFIDVELLGDAVPSQSRSVFGWPLLAPNPFWSGASDDDNSCASPLIVGGDAPAGNLTLEFVSGTDTKLEHDASGAYVQIAGAMPAGGVLVDVVAGTATKITGGADYSQYLIVNKPWWMELDPGSNAVTVTPIASVLASWVEQWR